MYHVQVTTRIHAPPQRCFDLARSVEAHVHSASHTREKTVGGRTSGLLELGEHVTWQARHLGVVHRLTSRITAIDPPRYFQDRMVQGPFRHFEHDHVFHLEGDGGTTMVDELCFAAPLPPVGWLAERLLLGPYLSRFLRQRSEVLKRIAESDEWLRFVPAA